MGRYRQGGGCRLNLLGCAQAARVAWPRGCAPAERPKGVFPAELARRHHRCIIAPAARSSMAVAPGIGARPIAAPLSRRRAAIMPPRHHVQGPGPPADPPRARLLRPCAATPLSWRVLQVLPRPGPRPATRAAAFKPPSGAAGADVQPARRISPAPEVDAVAGGRRPASGEVGPASQRRRRAASYPASERPSRSGRRPRRRPSAARRCPRRPAGQRRRRQPGGRHPDARARRGARRRRAPALGGVPDAPGGLLGGARHPPASAVTS